MISPCPEFVEWNGIATTPNSTREETQTRSEFICPRPPALTICLAFTRCGLITRILFLIFARAYNSLSVRADLTATPTHKTRSQCQWFWARREFTVGASAPHSRAVRTKPRLLGATPGGLIVTGTKIISGSHAHYNQSQNNNYPRGIHISILTNTLLINTLG